MNTKGWVGASILSLLAFAPAQAQNMADMLGFWSWQDYRIECKEGGEFGVSCKVVEGPKNVGMEMIQARPHLDGNQFISEIRHPATDETYSVAMKIREADRWYIVGCFKGEGGTCTHAYFTRAK